MRRTPVYETLAVLRSVGAITQEQFEAAEELESHRERQSEQAWIKAAEREREQRAERPWYRRILGWLP